MTSDSQALLLLGEKITPPNEAGTVEEQKRQ